MDPKICYRAWKSPESLTCNRDRTELPLMERPTAPGKLRKSRFEEMLGKPSSKRSRPHTVASTLPAKFSPSGYTLLILLFALTVLTLGLMVAVPVWETQIQREKEEELIFRGRQYIEAIRIFRLKKPVYSVSSP